MRTGDDAHNDVSWSQMSTSFWTVIRTVEVALLQLFRFNCKYSLFMPADKTPNQFVCRSRTFVWCPWIWKQNVCGIFLSMDYLENTQKASVDVLPMEQSLPSPPFSSILSQRIWRWPLFYQKIAKLPTPLQDFFYQLKQQLCHAKECNLHCFNIDPSCVIAFLQYTRFTLYLSFFSIFAYLLSLFYTLIQRLAYWQMIIKSDEMNSRISVHSVYS